MAQTRIPKRALARQARRTQRIIELQIAGLTNKEIVTELRDEGFPISERTILRMLKTPQHQAFVNELIRQQLQDITFNRQTNPEVVMKYCDGLLEKLIPKKIEQKVEGGTDVKFSFQEGLQALFVIAQRTDPQLLPGLLVAVKKLEDKP